MPDELAPIAEAAMLTDDRSLVDALAAAVAVRLDAGVPRPPRLGRFLEEWQQVIGPLEWATTTREQRRGICRSLTRTLGHHRIDELGQHEWNAYVVANHRRLSRRTLGLHLAILKVALRYGVKRRLLAAVPILEHSMPPRDEVRWLTVEEEALVLEACTDATLAVALRLGLHAGLRRGEVMGLRWADVDQARGVLHVRWQRVATGRPEGDPGTWPLALPKSKRRRDVPLPPALAEALKEHRHLRCPFVVCHPGGRCWSHPFAHGRLAELGRALGAAGTPVPGLRWHVLRHTYAARVLQGGCDLYRLSQLLGHASVRVTEMHYAHLRPSDLAAVVQGLGRPRSEAGETSRTRAD